MRLSDRVYYRQLYFTISLPQAGALRPLNVILLKGQQLCLVDSGVAYNLPELEALCAEAGAGLRDVAVVINTHCHADHAGGNAGVLKANPGVKFLCHELGQPLIEDIDRQFKARPIPGFYTLFGGSVGIDQALRGGETLDLGFPVQVIHTPGHSADSISLFLPQDSLLISGDSIPYVRDVPIYEDLPAMRASLARLAPLKPRYVLTAHGGLWDCAVSGDFFRQANAYLDRVQALVDEFTSAVPAGSEAERASFVLRGLGIESPLLPIFLRSLREHAR